MKKMSKTILLAVLCCLSNHFLSAQDTQGYYTFDYMKVAPGMHEEYLKLEKAWKKIHQANIKEGKYMAWELTRVEYPCGDNEEYNYVTRTNFRGEKQLANYLGNWTMPANLESLLSKEELALVERSSEIRTWVKSEVWFHEDMTVGKDINNEKIVVFNYFNFPESGSRTDHFRVEREIWKPVHEARIKDGKMIGWVMVGKTLPSGSAQPYFDATVDLYADWEQFLSLSNPIPYFEKIHAGKDFNQLFDETDAACDLLRQEVRMVLDNSDE
ncbi:MAG TPA: hypothetical protein PKA00_13515 [Saprospiraceae bacterium]|nr:hypothetical protein [Saprospiraceae bacterium]HMQ83928.1 hypothetical protein [Saprospiraceae bacterium]